MARRLASMSRCFFASAAALSRALLRSSRFFAATRGLASRSFLALAAATVLARWAAARALATARALASRSFVALAAAAAFARWATTRARATAAFLAAAARWAGVGPGRAGTFFADFTDLAATFLPP